MARRGEGEDPGGGPSWLPDWLWISPVAIMLLIGVAGATAFAIAALSLRDNPSTQPLGYFGTVAALTAAAADDLARIAPAPDLSRCLAADEAAHCAAQRANALAAIDRLGVLADAIGTNTPPFRAVIWHSAYLDALAALREALADQVAAIDARDGAGILAAVAATEAAVALEESLTAEFNEQFADQLR